MLSGAGILGLVLMAPIIIDYVGEQYDKKKRAELEEHTFGNQRTAAVCTTLYQSHEGQECYEPRGDEAPDGYARSFPSDDSGRI